MKEMTLEEWKRFWQDRHEVLSLVPASTELGYVSLMHLIEEGVRYRHGEARMDRVESARWADDGGRS